MRHLLHKRFRSASGGGIQIQQAFQAVVAT